MCRKLVNKAKPKADTKAETGPKIFLFKETKTRGAMKYFIV